MNSKYSDVTVRRLFPFERGTASNNLLGPLVIEPRAVRDCRFLEDFVRINSRSVLDDVATYGSVLLRGFTVESSREFERVILSIDGMRGMADVFMSEPGRDRADGCDFVLHTNTLYKTGGGFDFMSFHSENFYVPDVPRYISFLCMQPSLFGGETGLVDMAGVYADLPADLQRRLEKKTFACNFFPLTELQKRYGLKIEELEQFCVSSRLPIATIRGIKAAFIYKPCVFDNIVAQERTLVTNLSVELGELGLEKEMIAVFLRDFGAARWVFHRLLWRKPWIRHIPDLLRHPLTAFKRLLVSASEVRKDESSDSPRRLGCEFSKGDIRNLAVSIRRNFHCFLWRKGDILIMDNMKLEHAGMPGFGRRELRAMICNPIEMNGSPEASGIFASSSAKITKTLGERLAELGVGRLCDTESFQPARASSTDERG